MGRNASYMFLCLTICFVEWVLSTTLRFDKNTLNQPLKDKTTHIFSLLSNLAAEKLHMNDDQFKSVKTNCKMMFDALTGEFKDIFLP